jgi:hypothetical protein
MDVVGKAMQENRDRSVGGTCLVIGDVERAGVDMAERLEPLVG